ncbi:MAG: putative membrane protein [Idiomarinaceae bacterium HL-53]|nr:MAG: putative membrane protein [Idiomarinaceae bacterium HL-53]CUS47456.1 Uncharacterized membrane protein YccF, DUF307 family [Idiomarinaceae bacterium HL-53]
MRLLGNIIWLILGGWALFLLYLIAAIIFFPIFLPIARLALFSLWPFGQDVISKSELEEYKRITNTEHVGSAVHTFGRSVGTLLNILWIPVGLILAVIHFMASIANILLFFLIVTIPNIVGHWKMMGVAIFPFNKVIVPTEIAEEIRLTLKKKQLGIK